MSLDRTQLSNVASRLCCVADGADITSMSQEKQEQFQALRCSSTSRGSVYDKVAGEDYECIQDHIM